MQDIDLLHETKIHGELSFPYTVYKGNIPEYMLFFPLHWHDEMEIIHITRGRGIITVQSQSYFVETDDIVLISPQMMHSIVQYENSEMEYTNVLFRFSLLHYSEHDICYEKYLKSIYCHEKLPPFHVSHDSELNDLLRPHLMYLIENRKKSYTEHELMIKSNFFAIMHYICQHCTDANHEDLLLRNHYEKLKNVILHIHANYSQDISVYDAAKICGFSESHFMKLFRDLTGKSYIKYVVGFRLEIAAQQIVETDRKILRIAEDCGFRSMSYFARAFRKKYGMTPSAYREQKQKK